MTGACLRRMTGLMPAVLTAALMAAPPVQAQPVDTPPPVASSDIVVSARPKADFGTVQQQAIAVTRVGDMLNQPLARFQSPICPGIIGMSMDFAGLMVDRIRANAERIGLAVAKQEPCTPNILVAFVKDGQAEMKKMRNKRGDLFGGVDKMEFNKLAADPGPVHAWNSTSVRTRDGIAIATNREAGQIPELASWMAHSLIYLTTRLDIEASVVLIDTDAVEGMSVGQLADYVTMRSLARTRPTRSANALDTILSLFDPDGARPTELTTFDVAYLKGVYGGSANLPAYLQIGTVPRALREQSSEPAEPAGKR